MPSKKLITAFGLASFFSISTANAAGMLTDSKGMTLYTFDKDKGTTSSCYDECAVHWPPYMVQKGDKMGEDWGETKRKDGSIQWTYDEHPIYYYVEDTKPGDKLGDGKGGVWHIISE